jgi:thioredoxin-disulfide reductase
LNPTRLCSCKMANAEYDVIIIGGGCAGLAAALYSKRYTLKTLVLAKELGGLITTTHIVENYPGVLPASGWDMMNLFLKQMELLEVEMKEVEVATVAHENGNGRRFTLTTIDGTTYTSKAVIYATGTKRKELNAPGEKDYYGRGVSYCATCDGALFRGKKLGVIGGGDSAAKESLLLSEYGSHVWVIARTKLRAEPINAQRIEHNPKIDVLEGYQVKSIEGDGNKLTHVLLDKPYNGTEKLELEGLFIEIGHLPSTELAKGVGVAMNPHGEIMIDRESKTNVPGFFAAGDCTDTAWKQAIISAAEGSQAANSAYEYITKEFVKTK